MANIKKALVIGSSYVLIAALAIGGTLAYLKSTDDDVNVMTLGEVKIDQIELERIEQSDANIAADNLKDFEQDKPLYPAVYEGKYADWARDDAGNQVYQQFPTGGSSSMWNDDAKNVQDKIVFVENTGESNAYVRTWFAFEQGSMTYEEFDAAVGLNINNIHWSWETVAEGVEIGDSNYVIMLATYTGNAGANNDEHIGGILAPDQTSRPSLLQVMLYNSVTNEDVLALDGNEDGKYNILVFSQGMQTNGFSDPVTALNAGFGTAHPWGAYDAAVKAGNAWTIIEDAGAYELAGDLIMKDKSLARTHNATGEIVINGNGATVEMLASSVQTFDWTVNQDGTNGTIPLMSNVFSSADGSLVTVNDLTIAGTMQSVMAGNYRAGNGAVQGMHNTEFNNVNIVDTKVVSLSAGISPALSIYGTATLNNCNVYGTTLSPMDTYPQWPVYDMAVVNFTNTTVNGGKIGSIYTWTKAYLEINDAEIDTIISACRKTNDFKNGGLVIGDGTTVNTINVTNKNAVLTVKAGAVVDTIDLTAVTNKAGVTIEDGATVKNVVVDGVTVDFNTWKNS